MSVTKENLRIEFVEMLFALAIAQVAIEFSDAIFLDISFIKNPHVYSHLFLGTLITTMSWIGWQNSKSKGNSLGIDSIFSMPFLILLLDIVLVIFYFIIVRGADFSNTNNKANITLDIGNELYWSIWIFIVYILWDFITKGIDVKYKVTNGINVSKKMGLNVSAFFSRTWPGIICLIATLIYYNLNYTELTPWKAFTIDLCLVFIFILFRGLKPDIKRQFDVQKDSLPASTFNGISINPNVTMVKVSDKLYWAKISVSIILPLILIISTYFICKYL